MNIALAALLSQIPSGMIKEFDEEAILGSVQGVEGAESFSDGVNTFLKGVVHTIFSRGCFETPCRAWKAQ